MPVVTFGDNGVPVYESFDWGYTLTNKQQRFCNLFLVNYTGDEFYYLFECHFCKETRRMHLPKFYHKHVNILKFQTLMTNTKINYNSN